MLFHHGVWMKWCVSSNARKNEDRYCYTCFLRYRSITCSKTTPVFCKTWRTLQRQNTQGNWRAALTEVANIDGWDSQKYKGVIISALHFSFPFIILNIFIAPLIIIPFFFFLRCNRFLEKLTCYLKTTK